MSAFSYNNVQLPYAFATKFSHDVIYDDGPGGGRGGAPGGTDWYCTRFDISVQSIISIDNIDQIAPDLAKFQAVATQDNAAAIMKVIRTRLLQPRRSLMYIFNGVNIIPQNDFVDGIVDAQNGPQPQTCTISELYTGVFLLQFHIIAHYWENNQSTTQTGYGTINTVNRPGNPIISNRWTETVTFDGCDMSTREREGKIIIRSDNLEGKIADQVRTSMAVLSIPNGWLREQTRYTQSPDGLALHYRFVDKEQYKQPPAPAFKAKGRYTETATNMGAKKTGQVDLTLWGAKYTPQFTLIERALHIAAAYLSLRGNALLAGGGLTGNGFIILGHLNCSFDWFENVVNVSMQLRGAAPSGVKANPVGFMQTIGTRIPEVESNVAYLPSYTVRGSAGLLLQAAKYYDPNAIDLIMGTGDTGRKDQDNPAVGTGDTKVNFNRGLQPGQAGLKREPGIN